MLFLVLIPSSPLRPRRRVIRLAMLPWAVERRHLWPRSFRVGVRTVMLVAPLPNDVLLQVLSYCGRDWFPSVGDGVRAPGEGPRKGVARIQCEWCGRAPWKKANLLQCSACKQVRYCDKACQKSAWTTHKAWCKANRA